MIRTPTITLTDRHGVEVEFIAYRHDLARTSGVSPIPVVGVAIRYLNYDGSGNDVEWIGHDRGDDYYIKLGMRENSRKADEENFSPAMLEEHDRHDGSDLRRWIYDAIMDIRDECAAERRERFASDLRAREEVTA